MTRASIVFVTRGLHDAGGIERITSFIASELASRHYRIHIVCLQKKGPPFFPLNQGVILSYLNSSTLCGRIAELRRYYKKIHPTLIVSVGTNRSLLNVPAAKGYPLASWEHFNAQILSHPLHQLSRRIATRAGWIISLTQEDAEEYHRRFNSSRVVVIPNPITVKGLTREPGEHKRVLAMGRLKSQKGFDRLLRVWAKVQPSCPDWKLRIVGSGRLEPSLKHLITLLNLEDSVEMCPHTSDVGKHFSQSDIFALSSHYEGFGLVLLEAFSAHLPAIAFDVPCGPRTLISYKGGGILVPDNDLEAFGDALLSLIQTPLLREDLGEKAFQTAKDFAPEQILVQWEDFIASIIQS